MGEFIPTTPSWPHPNLRPRSEAEAATLVALSPDQVIFVFGSNQRGAHAGGAARTAAQYFGAIEGIPFGLRGRSFAIATIDGNFRTMAPMHIAPSVTLFLRFAAGQPELTFYVTPIGTGIAGLSHDQIAPLFAGAPSNCLLPPVWLPLLSIPVQNGARS
jgi:hypothetical protein